MGERPKGNGSSRERQQHNPHEKEQAMIEESIVGQMMLGRPISKELIHRAAPDTLQRALRKGLVYRIREGYNIEQYLPFASEETLQGALLEGLGHLIQWGYSIPEEYLHLITEETRRALLKVYIITAHSIPPEFHTYITKEEFVAFKDSITNPETLQSLIVEAVGLFFANLHAMRAYVEDIIKQRGQSEEGQRFLREALLDRSVLPVGLKIHLPKQHGMALQEILGETPFRILDEVVVANPLANPRLTALALEALDAYLQHQHKTSLEQFRKEGAFFQACLPQRLTQEEDQAIATIAFLFAKTYSFALTEKGELVGKLTTSHTDGIGLLLHDAGNVQGGYGVPVKDGSLMRADLTGRTDYFPCDTKEDIEAANLIQTLLVHAQDPQLRYHEIGKRFKEQVRTLLDQHGYSGWLSATYMYAQGEGADRLHAVITAITDIRHDDAEVIKAYNRKVEDIKQRIAAIDARLQQLEQESSSSTELLEKLNLSGVIQPRRSAEMERLEQEKESLLASLREAKTKTDSLLSVQLRNLLAQCRREIYEHPATAL